MSYGMNLRYTNPERAKEYFTASITMLMQSLSEVHRNVAVETWPLELAQDEFFRTGKDLEAREKKRVEKLFIEAGAEVPLETGAGDLAMPTRLNLAQTLDIVVVRCRENLGWLLSDVKVSRLLLEKMRFYIYEKCDENADISGGVNEWFEKSPRAAGLDASGMRRYLRMGDENVALVLKERYNFTTDDSNRLVESARDFRVIKL